MSLSTAIAPHLPYLRRFSRAVSGSQSSGDAMVAAMLEALIADVSLFPKASSERIALYQLFTRLFTTVSIRTPVDASSPNWEKQAQANLGALAPLQRQAFLLVAVEGFSEDEAAEILEMPVGEFAELLTQASTEVSRQMATDILIIEDEPLIAMDIEEMVESLGHRVVAVVLRAEGEGRPPAREVLDLRGQLGPLPEELEFVPEARGGADGGGDLPLDDRVQAAPVAGPPRDDVDHPQHGVRAVEHRAGTEDDLDVIDDLERDRRAE